MNDSKRSKIEPVHLEEAAKLKALYEERNVGPSKLSQGAFGAEHGIGSQGMVWQYLNGKSALNLEAALKFAQALKCEVADFSPRLAGTLPPLVRYELPPDYPLSPAVPAKPRALEDDAIPVRMHHVPVVGTTQGGPTTRVWTDGDLPVGDGMGWVSVSSRDRNAFALRVEGSSMAPRYEHGDYALVEPNRRPEPGDDVIVRLRGGECMIKRLSARRPHEIAFDSFSPGYDRITVAPDQIEYLYYVAGGLRAGSYVQHIQADEYEGPERRWHDEPVEPDRRKDGEK